MYGPAAAYAPAVWMRGFGENLFVLRAFFLATNMAAFLFIYFMCRALIPNRFFSYLAAIFAVAEAHHPYWASRWGGVRFPAAYAALLMLILFGRTRHKIFIFLAGVFSSLAFLHSFDFGAMSFVSGIVFLLFYYEFFRRDPSYMPVGKLIGHYLAGCLVLLAPFFAVLFWAGAGEAFWKHLLSLDANLIWTQPIRLGTRSAIKFFSPLIVYAASGLYLTIRASKPKPLEWRHHALFVLTVFGLFLYAYSFRAVQGPQFESSLAVCSVVAFCLLEKASRARRKTIAIGCLIAGLSFFLLSQKRFYKGNMAAWFSYQIRKFDILKDPDKGFVKKETLNARMIGGEVGRMRGVWLAPDQAEEVREVVSFVRENSKEDEPLFTFPDLGVFNFLCARPTVGRFTVSGAAWARPEWRTELLEALKAKKPKLALVSLEISDLALTTGRREEILPEIRGYLLTNYVLEKKVGTIAVYAFRE